MNKNKSIIQLLKIGACLSLLLFGLTCILAFQSLIREPLTLKVQNKYISGKSFVIEGINDKGGRVIAEYSESFFKKAQLGDTIRFKVAYRLLIKVGRITSIDIGESARFFPVTILSSIFPVLIFFPNNTILRRRFGYWLIGAAELFNLFLLSTFLLPL